MVEKSVVITHETGLHARPAGLVTAQAMKYQCKITLVHEDREIEAKSILGIMAAGIQQGATLRVQCDGPDEQEALQGMVGVFEGLA